MKQIVILFLLSAGLSCKRPSESTPEIPQPPAAKPAPSTTGAASAEELKELFLQRYHNNDVDGMVALFYLKGASAKMVELYSNAVPKADELTITSATIVDPPNDSRDDGEYTLTREKRLLLKFDPANQKGLAAVEQYFYIGRHEGSYYFTLPTGQ